MKGKKARIIKRVATIILVLLLAYFVFNAIIIYNYSSNYSEKKSDVAIVLGAGTSNGKLSPIFIERINHAIYLYNNNRVQYIILTGGYGKGQTLADSEVAKSYTLAQGVPDEATYIDTKSQYTIENLEESKRIMDSLNLNSALIVSDPLHMKRSMVMAKNLKMEYNPSPTKTTRYKSFFPKLKSLIYESFFYSIAQLTFQN